MWLLQSIHAFLRMSTMCSILCSLLGFYLKKKIHSWNSKPKGQGREGNVGQWVGMEASGTAGITMRFLCKVHEDGMERCFLAKKKKNWKPHRFSRYQFPWTFFRFLLSLDVKMFCTQINFDFYFPGIWGNCPPEKGDLDCESQSKHLRGKSIWTVKELWTSM